MKPIINNELRWTLWALSSPPWVQQNAFPKELPVAEELALEFEQHFEYAMQAPDRSWTETQEKALSDLDSQLAQMSGGEKLHLWFAKTDDARVTGNGDIWETYPRVSALRWFPVPDWAKDTASSVPAVPWLDERKPHAAPKE